MYRTDPIDMARVSVDGVDGCCAGVEEFTTFFGGWTEMKLVITLLLLALWLVGGAKPFTHAKAARSENSHLSDLSSTAPLRS